MDKVPYSPVIHGHVNMTVSKYGMTGLVGQKLRVRCHGLWHLLFRAVYLPDNFNLGALRKQHLCDHCLGNQVNVRGNEKWLK